MIYFNLNTQNFCEKKDEEQDFDLDNKYIIKLKNGKGYSNFEFDKYFKYENMIYFDFETIKVNQKIDSVAFLNTTKKIITSFSLLIPKNLFKNKRKIEELINLYNLDFQILEKDEFYLVNVYDKNRIKIYSVFKKILKILSNKRKNDDIIKLVGFNSNKFDTLLLRKIDNFKLEYNRKNNSIKFKIFEDEDLDKIFVKGEIYDIIFLAKSFGFYNLKKLGDFINLEKLNITKLDTLEKFFKYNSRDVEILFYFLKHINEKYGIYSNNVSSYSRKYFLKKLSEKFDDVEYIHTNKKINKFNLFGARIEMYKNKIYNCDYVDVNSLYSSARFDLDIVSPNKKNKNLNYDLETIFFTNNLKILLDKLEKDFLGMYEKKEYFDYKNLKNLYDKYFKNNFYLTKVKLKSIKNFKFKKMIEFYFPFVIKNSNKSCFQFFENEIYEVGFYEFLFLIFFDFEFVEVYKIKKSECIWKNNIENLYELRKTDKENKAFYKLLLNSGYGIWNTKNEKSELLKDEMLQEVLDKNNNFLEFTNEVKYRNEFFKVKKLGNYFYKLNNENKKWLNNTIPILGLNIVSNSRFYMFSLILNNIYFQEHQIFYTDTDSFFCSKEFTKILESKNLIGNNLCQLKKEVENVEMGLFLNPKTYLFVYKNSENNLDIKVVSKGVGVTISKNIVVNNFRGFQNYNRKFINVENVRKRKLQNNTFFNVLDKDNDEFNLAVEEFEKFVKMKIDFDSGKGEIMMD